MSGVGFLIGQIHVNTQKIRWLNGFRKIIKWLWNFNLCSSKGVRNYEELALKEHYFEALVELCKIYNIECDIEYDKKLNSILSMESEITYRLKEMILEFEK